jgi:hypothetical protein
MFWLTTETATNNKSFQRCIKVNTVTVTMWLVNPNPNFSHKMATDAQFHGLRQSKVITNGGIGRWEDAERNIFHSVTVVLSVTVALSSSDQWVRWLIGTMGQMGRPLIGQSLGDCVCCPLRCWVIRTTETSWQVIQSHHSRAAGWGVQRQPKGAEGGWERLEQLGGRVEDDMEGNRLKLNCIHMQSDFFSFIYRGRSID